MQPQPLKYVHSRIVGIRTQRPNTDAAPAGARTQEALHVPHGGPVGPGGRICFSLIHPVPQQRRRVPGAFSLHNVSTKRKTRPPVWLHDRAARGLAGLLCARDQQGKA